MNELPVFGLANTITGFATLLAGLTCLVLARLIHPHPGRWRFAYWTIVVTGVFTVTLHGFGETNPVLGARWFRPFLDTGSNFVVAWPIALAVRGDGYDEPHRSRARAALTAATAIGVAWHVHDCLLATERAYLVPLGEWGGFYPGETWLMGTSLVVGLFLLGMLLATARNDVVVFPFFAVHALWHLVGAFAFIGPWAFNHLRFAEGAVSESRLSPLRR